MKKLLSVLICVLLMNIGNVQAKNSIRSIGVNKWTTIESKADKQGKNPIYYALKVTKNSFVYFNWQTSYNDWDGYRQGKLDIYMNRKKLINSIDDDSFRTLYLKKGTYYLQYNVRSQRGIESMKSKLKLACKTPSSIPVIRWKHQYRKNVKKGDVLAYSFKAKKKSYLRSKKLITTDTHLLTTGSTEDEKEDKLLNKGTYYIFNYASKKGKYEYKANLVPMTQLMNVKKHNSIKNAYGLKFGKIYAGRTTENHLYFKFRVNKTKKLSYTSPLPNQIMVIKDQYVSEKNIMKQLKKATAAIDGEKSTFTVKKGTYYLIVNGHDSADYPYFKFKLSE